MKTYFALLTLVFTLPLYSHAKGSDHIGAYNWKVTVDSVHIGRQIMPTPIAADIPVVMSKKTPCETKLCSEPEEILSLTFEGLHFSNNPEALASLQKALADGHLSIELTDNRSGERAFYSDFRGRIKRVRIRERQSALPGNGGNTPSTLEVIEFSVSR